MAGYGSPPGVRRGGRKKGSRNKVTQAARIAFEQVYQGRLVDLDRWIRETGDGFEVVKINKAGDQVTLKVGKDPGKASDLLLRMAEHFIPKLGRLEHVGDGGGAVK